MTNTIKCVILDDELLAISYLKLLCGQIEGVEVVKAFNRPEDFLREIHTIDCQVCFLDIEMPGIKGLEVATFIPDKHVIFTTAYKEYAAEAFDLNVVDYIRKPLKIERLEQAFDKLKQLIKKAPKVFFEWNTDLGRTKISADSVLYVKTSDIDSRDKAAFLDNESTIVLKNINLKTLLEHLPHNRYVQINKKELIAISAVKLFSDTEIFTTIVVNGESLKLQLSPAFKESFYTAFKV